MAAVLSHLKMHGRTKDIRDRSSSLLFTVLSIPQVFLSQGYFHLIDYFQVGYYPSSKSSNRISLNAQRSRFPIIQRITIDEFGENKAREMTDFTKPQLHLIFLHLWIPDAIRYSYSNRVNCGEQFFLHYLVYNRLGITKLQMSLLFSRRSKTILPHNSFHFNLSLPNILP